MLSWGPLGWVVCEDVPQRFGKSRFILKEHVFALIFVCWVKNDLHRTVFSCFSWRSSPAGLMAQTCWARSRIDPPQIPFLPSCSTVKESSVPLWSPQSGSLGSLPQRPMWYNLSHLTSTGSLCNYRETFLYFHKTKCHMPASMFLCHKINTHAFAPIFLPSDWENPSLKAHPMFQL